MSYFLYTLAYGGTMSILGALLVAWAWPFARNAAARRTLYANAYDAAIHSYRRWGFDTHPQLISAAANAMAKCFVERAAIIGFDAAFRELDDWIDRANETNNLIRCPEPEAIDALKTAHIIRFRGRMKK